MTAKATGENGGKQTPLHDRIIFDPRAKYGIPVETFVDYFGVINHEVRSALEKNPTLCYLLGSSTDQPVEVTDTRDSSVKQKYILTEGSGMFGLKNEEEAREWAGIFNHSIGSARQIEFVASKLSTMTPEQRQQFIDAGFDFTEYDTFESAILPGTFRDTFIPSHLSRRSYDERNRYTLKDDTAHPQGTTSTTAENQLKEFKASDQFWTLIKKVEAHSEHMIQEVSKRGYFDNILDAMLTYCDWTFGQETVGIDDRFNLMKAQRKDLDPNILEAFRVAGNHFENVFNQVFQTDLLQELKQLQPPEWEIEIRKAYCAASGIKFADAFPAFIAQYPQLQDQV